MRWTRWPRSNAVARAASLWGWVAQTPLRTLASRSGVVRDFMMKKRSVGGEGEAPTMMGGGEGCGGGGGGGVVEGVEEEEEGVASAGYGRAEEEVVVVIVVEEAEGAGRRRRQTRRTPLKRESWKRLMAARQASWER